MNQNIVNYFKKKVSNQKRIATFFDLLIIRKPENSLKEQEILHRIKETLDVSMGERFVKINSRLNDTLKSDLAVYDRICSQGTINSVEWKGKTLIKSAQDFTIYPMLIWEIKPKTIIELGSTASSLEWLTDLTKIMGLTSKIVGVDLNSDFNIDSEVDFIQGDIKDIKSLLKIEYLCRLPKPWLIIEDAHSNLHTILNYLSSVMSNNDYLVIEDSISKQKIISHWIDNDINSELFFVDKKYTDFFGVNSSSAVNSVLKKIDKVGV